MKQKRFSKKEKTALIVLAVLMVVVLAVGVGVIVHNTNVANELALNPENTTISGVTLPTKAEINGDNDSSEVTASENETEKTTKKATEKATEKTTQKATQSTTKAEPTEAATKATTPKPTANNGSVTPIATVKPTSDPSHTSKDVCKINGKKFYVGDTVTIAVDIKTPVTLINYQGETAYDREYLKATGTKSNVNGVANESNGTIYYNGSDINNGFNFTKTGTIYTATFKVLKSGSTEIENIMKILTDMHDNDVSVSKCTISVNVY